MSPETILTLIGKLLSRTSGQWIILLTACGLVGLSEQKLYAGDDGNTHYGAGALSFADMGFGNSNSAFGEFALTSCRGDNNTAIGFNALSSNNSGGYNTASGNEALASNNASFNTATGNSSLHDNTTGALNTATGAYSLVSNTTGTRNAANGGSALYSNTVGNYNTASGTYALFYNTTGSSNTATGLQALLSNTTGNSNLASGYQALYSNTTGNNNMANGASALYGNTTGFYNMANGSFAMAHNTKGNYNVAEGLNALFANTTGSNNIAIGLAAGGNLTTGSGNIDIGNRGVAAEGNTIRIGSTQNRTFLSGVRNAVVAGGVAVYASASGQLGTNPSSKRFKQDIATMDKKSEAILALRPVTFRYKEKLDPTRTAQFGLIAEEVAKVNPELVARDDKGQIYSVRYEAVNAMLLNEFLKEHQKVETQQKQITSLSDELKAQAATHQHEIAILTSALKEQATQIQKVSAQMTLEKAPSPKVVTNNNR